MRLDHWSWAYARARATVAWFQWRHPECPWLTADAVHHIEQWLQPHHAILEWGAGRSTGWFAQRASRMVSIEHDAAWYERVKAGLTDSDDAAVDLRLAPVDSDAYVTPPNIAPPFDLILIDGRRRDECALQAVQWVAPGGWLVVDDAERYLPLHLRPASLPQSPPDLRGRGEGAATPIWAEVAESLSSWALTWTSDGVSDTVIAQRPSVGPLGDQDE